MTHHADSPEPQTGASHSDAPDDGYGKGAWYSDAKGVRVTDASVE